MDELISKKDLLQETGISYGQLYRWKRERLIPDAWFEKRSSYTGQETFFPRTLILERVHFILTHKDEYSLTELRELLSPESVSRSYDLHAVSALPGASRSALFYEAIFHRCVLNHGQALSVVIAANYDEQCHPSDSALCAFLSAMDRWEREECLFSRSEGRLYVVRQKSRSIPLFFSANGDLHPCAGVQIDYSLSLNEISRTFTRMLNQLIFE